MLKAPSKPRTKDQMVVGDYSHCVSRLRQTKSWVHKYESKNMTPRQIVAEERPRSLQTKLRYIGIDFRFLERFAHQTITHTIKSLHGEPTLPLSTSGHIKCIFVTLCISAIFMEVDTSKNHYTLRPSLR
eukprot:4353101-Amphidinium_carterae.1